MKYDNNMISDNCTKNTVRKVIIKPFLRCTGKYFRPVKRLHKTHNT